MGISHNWPRLKYLYPSIFQPILIFLATLTIDDSHWTGLILCDNLPREVSQEHRRWSWTRSRSTKALNNTDLTTFSSMNHPPFFFYQKRTFRPGLGSLPGRGVHDFGPFQCIAMPLTDWLIQGTKTEIFGLLPEWDLQPPRPDLPDNFRYEHLSRLSYTPPRYSIPLPYTFGKTWVEYDANRFGINKYYISTNYQLIPLRFFHTDQTK